IAVNDADIVKLAHENQTAVLLSLSLIDPEGAFSSAKLIPLLTDIELQNRVISGMINEISFRGAQGMDIDMEYIPPQYKAEFAAFVSNAAAQLHAEGYILNIDLAPKTSAAQRGSLYEAHDYAALGAAADLVFLMTYEWGYQYPHTRYRSRHK
ncbi:MAG: glycoside hydrolase, partial [Oscillospiraceae bacterium]